MSTATVLTLWVLSQQNSLIRDVAQKNADCANHLSSWLYILWIFIFHGLCVLWVMWQELCRRLLSSHRLAYVCNTETSIKMSVYDASVALRWKETFSDAYNTGHLKSSCVQIVTGSLTDVGQSQQSYVDLQCSYVLERRKNVFHTETFFLWFIHSLTTRLRWVELGEQWVIQACLSVRRCSS